jgi:NADH-quinone oxidoreductase subunit E
MSLGFDRDLNTVRCPFLTAWKSIESLMETENMPDGLIVSLKREFKGERGELVSILQRVQKREGYLRKNSVRQISRWLKMSENEIFGVATFYAQFRFHPPGEHHLRVCLGTACHVKGGEQILETAKLRLKVETGETTVDGKYDLERVACLGCCALAPVVTFDDRTFSQMSVLKIQRILDDHENP